MSYEISDDCVGCGLCAKKCPANAIEGVIKKRFEIDPVFCEECGACYMLCPKAAIIAPDGKRRLLLKGQKRKQGSKASIDPHLCAGCQTCLMNCPQEAIYFIKKVLRKGYCQVDHNACIGCGTCLRFCLTGAIDVE